MMSWTKWIKSKGLSKKKCRNYCMNANSRFQMHSRKRTCPNLGKSRLLAILTALLISQSIPLKVSEFKIWWRKPGSNIKSYHQSSNLLKKNFLKFRSIWQTVTAITSNSSVSIFWKPSSDHNKIKRLKPEYSIFKRLSLMCLAPVKSIGK